MTASAGPGGIVPIFATPFAAVDTGVDPPFNERLATLCESQCAAQASRSRDPLCFRGADDFLDSADAALDLKRVILSRAAGVLSALSTDSAEFARLHIQARGWCCIVRPNGHVSAQHFPDAS